MKKRATLVAVFLMSLLLTLVTLPVSASSGTHDVEYDGKNLILNSNEEINKLFKGLQPGDEVEFEITFANEGTKKTHWYLANKVLKSLEDSGDAAKNGGYSYKLTYVGPSGTQVLYDSEAVGGEDSDGLKEATQSTEEYFYLDSLNANQAGKIVVKVGLDGESQPNTYMNTQALLEVSFAVEEEESEIFIIPVTGDNFVEHMARNRGFYYSVFVGSFAMTIMSLAALLVLGRKKEGRA